LGGETQNKFEMLIFQSVRAAPQKGERGMRENFKKIKRNTKILTPGKQNKPIKMIR